MAVSKMKYVGVDGCPYGWFSVGLDDGEGFKVEKFETFSELVEHYSDACLILVDMPIGVPDNGASSYRKCDEAARQKLDKRKPSVFKIPSRRFLDKMRQETTWKHLEANKWSKKQKELQCRGISAQSFGIVRKIIEVDNALTRNNVGSPVPIREIHPEICFWALKGGKEMKHKKNVTGLKGINKRLKVLKRLCIEPNVENIYYAALGKYLRKHVDHDDILDALVAAVTAKIHCREPKRRRVLESPKPDSKGLPMEMVYVI